MITPKKGNYIQVSLAYGYYVVNYEGEVIARQKDKVKVITASGAIHTFDISKISVIAQTEQQARKNDYLYTKFD